MKLNDSFADDITLEESSVLPGFLRDGVDHRDLNLLVPCELSGSRCYAIADCGSMVSCISPAEVKRLQLEIRPAEGRLGMAKAGLAVPRLGTVCVELAIGTHRHVVSLEVLDTGEPLLLGLDLFPTFGIRVEGIPTSFPGGTTEALNSRLLGDQLGPTDAIQWNESDRVDSELLGRIFAECADALKVNEKIPSRHFCSHPCSKVFLPTGDAAPQYRRQYPISRRYERFIDEQVQSWIDDGVVEPGSPNSKWNSPLLAVPKRDEFNKFTTARCCIDPRLVNSVLEDDSRAIPRIQELFAQLEGFAVVSELDLKQSYTQFEIHGPDRIKTSFTWRGRRLQFRGSPFGFKHLTAHFQNVMQVLFENEDFVLVYVDNVMVVSKKAEDHPKHLRQAIEILNKWNLKLNFEKTHVGYTRLRLLGHVLGGDTRAPDPDKIDDVFSCPRPETVRQLAAFLGLTNYLRDYIPLYSTLAAPLEAARTRVMKDKVVWNDECEKSFQAFKKILQRAPVLSAPRDGVRFICMTDASKVGAGAALAQFYDGRMHYIRFASRSFNSEQSKYSATRRELLAIIFALKTFRGYLLGTNFDLWTDHRALTFMFTQKTLSDVLLNWLDVLLDFDMNITHKPGILMTLPDALSRLFPVRMRDATKMVRKITLHVDEGKVEPERELRRFVNERFSRECPSVSDRPKLLQQFHAAGHFGSDTLFKKLWHAGYFWPGMRRDCAAVVSTCDQCIKWNLARVGFSPMRSISASLPFDHISVDLLSLNKTSPRGNNYILVLVDICTRFVILRALKDKAALTVARCLWEIVCDFGIPKIIQSDNGPEFVNQVVEALCELMGVDHRLVSAYNPRANGSAESHVKIVLNCLRKMCKGNFSNFDLFLPAVQSAINTKPAGLHGNMPAELFFGRPLNTLRDYSRVESEPMSEDELEARVAVMMDLVYPTVFQRSQRAHALNAKRANAKRRVLPAGYAVGSTVMIQDVVRGSKTEPYWVGPYRILKKSRGGAYSLLDAAGRLLGRPVPPSQMKLVSAPPQPALARAVADQDPGAPSFDVDKILKQRGKEGQREYLVRWKDTWEPEANFDDQQVIQDFWDGK